MVVPTLTYDELKELLNDNGWNDVCSDFWNDHNRIIFVKGSINFPLPYRKVYGYPFVVKLCLSLDIAPPEDHLRCYEQYEAYKQKKRDQEENGGGSESNTS